MLRRRTPMRHARRRARRRWPAVAVAVVACAAVVAFFAGGTAVGLLSGVTARSRAAASPTSPAPGTGGAKGGGGPAAPAKPATEVTSYGVTARWVQKENAKPGTTAWRITQPATYEQISGYASKVSINEGGTVDLYVSTDASTYTIQAFRMGYYAGKLGRLVWTSPTETGIAQPTCPLQMPLRTVECSWASPVSVATTASGWPQGDYLFKLTASSGYQSYVPLTIRNDASHAAYLINNDVTTWQAYNTYGGYSLYQGPTTSGGSTLSNRAYAVSFDRPYAFSEGAGQGAADFLGLELKMVAMMESRGLDVSYTTDVNVSENPALLLNHKAFITLGHDEYYSLSMRNGVKAARAAGVNLIFLGANAIYRHIRLASTPLGRDRLEIDYKNPLRDPLYGIDNANVTPWAWRDPPNNKPESTILGEMWACNPAYGPMVISDAGNWMFAGTGLVDGSQIPNVIGPEFDSWTPYQPAPPNVTVVANSPVTCDGKVMYANMTYYSWIASGAGVWDTGTIDWVGSIQPDPPGAAHVDAVTQITANVLAAFGAGPAGRQHPSVAVQP